METPAYRRSLERRNPRAGDMGIEAGIRFGGREARINSVVSDGADTVSFAYLDYYRYGI